MWKTAFKKLELIYGLPRQTISLQMFKGCFPQILLGPFLNTLIQIYLWSAPFILKNFDTVRRVGPCLNREYVIVPCFFKNSKFGSTSKIHRILPGTYNLRLKVSLEYAPE